MFAVIVMYNSDSPAMIVIGWALKLEARQENGDEKISCVDVVVNVGRGFGQ